LSKNSEDVGHVKKDLMIDSCLYERNLTIIKFETGFERIYIQNYDTEEQDFILEI